MAQYGPGAAWYTAGRNTKIEHLANESSTASERHCRFYTVDASGNLTGHNTTYASGELHVVKNTDEDLNTTYTFTDKQERTLLERRMAATGMHDTYYVYDSFDRLRFVLQPMYQENPDLTKHAFRYTYDGRGRCIRKKLPGAGEVEYRYNSLNQLTYSQDGNQRAASRWTFYEYDTQARLVRQGESTGSTPSNNGTVHIVNFYDSYSFIGSRGFTATQYTADTSGYGRGALTGSIVSLLDGSGRKLYIAYYYDIKGRMLKAIQNNLLEGYDVISTNYTFTDKPASVAQAHTASGKTARTAVHIYTYDHANRISKVHHLLNSTMVTLYNVTYDDISRLATKSLHGSSANKLTYTYNVRSWLTGITSTKLTQNLYYNTGVGTPKYNGSISSMTWKAGTESTIRGYKFSYDGLDRMQNATYGETASINTNTNRFSENVTAYDKNGNIKNLQRYGQTSAATYGLLDNLTYTLTGNQLSRVDDAASTAAYGTNTAFVNGASAAGEYAYDVNGNLTKDLNKGITGITYNVLNLPSVVTFSDKSTITYTYAANGTKLRTAHKIGSTTTTTDYCGNVIYENGTQKLLLTEEGYVNLTGTQLYHYYLKDHQGNNRVVISQGGSAEETNHYYPFGGVFASTNTQPFKYNGKELDTKKGLNWYDYGARHYDAVLGRFITIDPLAEMSYSVSTQTYCLNNPMNLVDPTGCFASTHTDSLGNVVDVFNDGDLGVYSHNTDKEGTKQELEENHSASNTSAGGEKRGETYEWDSFMIPDTQKPYGHINFGSFEASQMVFNRFRYLSTLKMKPLELAIYALNANNGEYFDIKHGNPYKGSQFGKGKYISMRDAGNILAGMIARRGGLSAKVTYTAFGALQLSNNNRLLLPKFLFQAGNLGAKGSYGETPISHIFQKRGYELNFK